MDLTYEDVFNYLKQLKKCMKINKINLDESLYKKSKRKELLSQGCLTNYGTILEKCGINNHDTVAQFHTLPDILNNINENTAPILLSSLVVNKDSYLPGDKYFEMWHQLKNLSDEEKVELWLQDLKELMNPYSHIISVDDEDSRIGCLTWDACQKCKHFTENGCAYTASMIVDQACNIQDGIIYCSMYEESDK